MASILASMYSTTPDAPLGRTGKDAFEAMKMIRSISEVLSKGLGLPAVPSTGKAASWAAACSSRAADQGRRRRRRAFAEIGGWDHHGTEYPQLFNLLRQFSTSIAAFCQDLGDRMEDIAW